MMKIKKSFIIQNKLRVRKTIEFFAKIQKLCEIHDYRYSCGLKVPSANFLMILRLELSQKWWLAYIKEKLL